jgi:glycosyltransferase involved in cell wall biosynthesis
VVAPLRRLGLSVGLRSDNTLQHSDFRGIKGLVKKLILPHWLRNYDCWHPVGTLAREYLEALAGPVRPCHAFPYNVDNQWFSLLAEESRRGRPAALAALGFPVDSLVVLGVMKWHQREDPLTLIDGFCAFAASEPRARLVLVGDGPMRPQVRTRLVGLDQLVHTPGYVSYSALPALYGLADIFVHPAPGEPWGVSVNEALACGVPVIASSGVGAGRDLIIEGSTGAVFPAGDGAALAACLHKLVRHVSAEQRQACRDRVAGWGYDTTIETFTRLLQSLEN